MIDWKRLRIALGATLFVTGVFSIILTILFGIVWFLNSYPVESIVIVCIGLLIGMVIFFYDEGKR